MIETRFIPYTHIENLSNMKPNIEILLGKKLVWTEKRDGDNLFLWNSPTDENPKRIMISSRNQANAGLDFQIQAKSTEQFQTICDSITDEKYHDKNVGRYGIYVELLRPGIGHTRIEVPREKTSLVVFDIYDFVEGNFLHYTPMYQHCYHWGIPVVEKWAESTHTTKESLMDFVQEILKLSWDKKREGSVAKFVDPSPKADPRFIYTKVKLDIPSPVKLIKHDEGEVVLPDLPEGEISAEWGKLVADYGVDKLRDVGFAMPLFVEQLHKSARENNCKMCKNPFAYYKRFLLETT